MIKVSHTPGPWTTLANEIQSEDGHCIAEVTGGDGCTYYDDGVNAECAANMRLMAAAPELLKALRLVESEYGYMGDADTCECGEFSDGVIDGKPCEHRIVRAAIAKATGE